MTPDAKRRLGWVRQVHRRLQHDGNRDLVDALLHELYEAEDDPWVPSRAFCLLVQAIVHRAIEDNDLERLVDDAALAAVRAAKAKRAFLPITVPLHDALCRLTIGLDEINARPPGLAQAIRELVADVIHPDEEVA